MEEIKLINDFKIVNIDDVVPNKWNPNEQTDFIFEKEIESFKKYGMLDPITVRRINDSYEIVDGEHRWKAAKHLGMHKVIVNDLGDNFNEIDAQQLTIILNETRGAANYQKLSELMKVIANDVGLENLKVVMPYSDIEINSMISKIDIDWETIKPNMNQSPIESSDSFNEAGSPNENGLDTYVIRLPNEDMLSLKEQLDRIKRVLFPEFNTEEVSDTEIWMAITYILRSTPDEKINLDKEYTASL